MDVSTNGREAGGRGRGGKEQSVKVLRLFSSRSPSLSSSDSGCIPFRERERERESLDTTKRPKVLATGGQERWKQTKRMRVLIPPRENELCSLKTANRISVCQYTLI